LQAFAISDSGIFPGAAEFGLDQETTNRLMSLENNPAQTGATEAYSHRARTLYEQGKLDEAVTSYREAIALDSQNATLHNDLGNVQAVQGKLKDAIASYQKALEIWPDYVEANNNLANLHQMTGNLEDAAARYEKAIQLRPDYAQAHRNLGSLLYRQGKLPEAVGALRTAVSLDPSFAEAASLLEHQQRHLCDWRGLEALSRSLIRMVEHGSGGVNPFAFLCLGSTPEQHLRCARQWSARNVPCAVETPHFQDQQSDRITVGYLSADFHEHATAHLISELFELHDRQRFQIIGYSYGPDDGSPARARLTRSFEKFVDIREESFSQSAARIHEDGVQILVDLKGYTADARPGIVALRPAPVQVSYLGFPGTMGTNVIDYAIVDRVVAPPEDQAFFTEKLVRMPDCYQVNDSTRTIAPALSRGDCGLPNDAFVFCCFNASYKITPKAFSAWTKLLKLVPTSVLWLLDSNPHATANLKREAADRGVDPDRLIFAGHVPYPEHLARFAIADLFLDTFPYNAHTLASDALWGGCPVLTCSGRTFASRVAGSLLQSLGLPELICRSLSDYEALAVALARDPERLRGIRERLEKARHSAPVFDAQRFTRNLEKAFLTIWDLYRRGESPRPFAV
jgi:predicted O-linked N-acetylglucosamine transferase (SPINDLY family)